MKLIVFDEFLDSHQFDVGRMRTQCHPRLRATPGSAPPEHMRRVPGALLWGEATSPGIPGAPVGSAVWPRSSPVAPGKSFKKVSFMNMYFYIKGMKVSQVIVVKTFLRP